MTRIDRIINIARGPANVIILEHTVKDGANDKVIETSKWPIASNVPKRNIFT
jgi:hypothetical protein